MPYRRLPNTDAARLRALKKAFTKGTDLSPIKLAFSQATLYKIRTFLPTFENAVASYKKNLTSTTHKQSDFPELMRKTKLYISHFIQVVNMCIARGEMQPAVRRFFGLDEDDLKVPEMHTEADIIKWGEIVIKGENERIRSGMHPMTNPTIAMVKVKYQHFVEAYYSKSLNKQSTTRLQSDIVTLRGEADQIILQLWNEIESYYADCSDELLRQNAAEYGISYVFRKSEAGYHRHKSSVSDPGQAAPAPVSRRVNAPAEHAEMLLF